MAIPRVTGSKSQRYNTGACLLESQRVVRLSHGVFDPPTYNRGVENGTIIASQVARVEPDLRGRVVHTLATPSADLSSAIDTTAQLPLVRILR
ncbi:hypothetical protein THTE_2562 [Thermogutta terrifontis]|uniref:Uncharacterized protein n=1 Tax=Thermogutta terrifontis TaxID=1331910 RepID=A0A286RGR6_9BACT|nr:hypothetical protein THTE_2562 [Thermogutta terrifontis]